VHNGTIDYRRITMEKPYAQVGENGVQYAGPALLDEQASSMKIAVFGPHAEEIIRSPETVRMLNTINENGKQLSLIAIPSETSWGKASEELVKAVYGEHVLAMIALDRLSSHLAEQIAVKSFVPVHLFRSCAHLYQHPVDFPFAAGHSSFASSADSFLDD
jgi:hypothetical protein